MKMTSEQAVMSPAELKLLELQKQKQAEREAKANNQALALIPNSLILVVDSSSSMDLFFGKNMSRAQAAQAAMRRIISASSSKESAYSLITFNDQPHLIYPMGTPYAKFMATRFEPSGYTSLFPALQLCLHQNPTRIIVLTDGATFDKPQCLEIAAGTYKSKGIKIDCVAIGDGEDEFLKSLCEITGGKFRRASDPGELEQIFLSFEPKNYLMLEHKS